MGAGERWKSGDLADFALVGARQRWPAMIQVVLQLRPNTERLPLTRLGRILSAMSDVIARLNAALDGRYNIECGLGEGGMAT